MKKYFKYLLTLAPAGVLFTSCETNTPNEVPCSITSNTTFSDINPNGVDYVIDCVVEVTGGTLTIEPGTTIEFRTGAGIFVSGQGSIYAVGTASLPIIMKGNGVAGAWRGIEINSNNATNTIGHCKISDAGGEVNFSAPVAWFIHDTKAAIVNYGKLNLHHTVIRNSGGAGIAASGGGEFTGFTADTIVGNNGFPILMYAGAVNQTDLPSCVFSGNTKNAVALYGRTSNAVVEEEVTLNKIGIPYRAFSSLEFREDVVINAGVIIETESDMGIYITGNGSLRINGTSSEPVVMRGVQQLAGYWRGLLINTNNPLNVFDYLNISDGGSSVLGFNPPKANIAVGAVAAAQLTINNCVSTNADGCQVAVSTTDGTLDYSNSPAITDVCTY